MQEGLKRLQADVEQVQVELKKAVDNFTGACTGINAEISSIKASVEELGIRLRTLETRVECVFSLDDQRNARFLERFPQHRLCVAGTTRAAS